MRNCWIWNHQTWDSIFGTPANRIDTVVVIASFAILAKKFTNLIAVFSEPVVLEAGSGEAAILDEAWDSEAVILDETDLDGLAAVLQMNFGLAANLAAGCGGHPQCGISRLTASPKKCLGEASSLTSPTVKGELPNNYSLRVITGKQSF